MERRGQKAWLLLPCFCAVTICCVIQNVFPWNQSLQMGTHNKTAQLGFVTASPLYQSNVLWIFESSSQAHIKAVSWMLLSWIPFPATSGYLYVYVIQFDSFQSVTVQFQSDSQCIWFFSCFQCKCTALQYTCCCRHIPFCLMYTFSLKKKKKNQMMNFCGSI